MDLPKKPYYHEPPMLVKIDISLSPNDLAIIDFSLANQLDPDSQSPTLKRDIKLVLRHIRRTFEKAKAMS